jgi:hypothetical protein
MFLLIGGQTVGPWDLAGLAEAISDSLRDNEVLYVTLRNARVRWADEGEWREIMTQPELATVLRRAAPTLRPPRRCGTVPPVERRKKPAQADRPI